MSTPMTSTVVVNGDRPNEDWPDKELLETALRKWLKDPKLKVQEFTSKIATNKGDNYTSDMFRVTAKCEQEKELVTIVVKRIITTGTAGSLIMKSTAFQREEQMLSAIIPVMYAALKKSFPDAEPFGAGYVYSIRGVLMMEDLQPRGFRMAQRRLGLDLNHCSLVLRTLARYHAASVLLMEQKSIDFSVFRQSIFGEKQSKEEMENFCTGVVSRVPSFMAILCRFKNREENICLGMLRTLSDELETFAGLEKYSAKLSAFVDRNFLSLLEKVVEEHEDDDFRVLSHGDLWVNNILFRYSPSGEPDGVRFVDLQMSSITSPCIDIQYFLTASSNELVRTSCTGQLLEEYHDTLCKTMAALGCSTRPPTIEKLKQDFDKRTHYGMFAAFNVMPIVLGEAGLFDFNDMVETGKPQNELFRSKSYKKALEWFLPLYERKGYL